MNILLWVLQGAGAALYLASGTMKAFLFDKVSHDVPSFGALPKRVWGALGIFELCCVAGLLAYPWYHALTITAAALLAFESLVFIWVHVKYREVPPIIMCMVLGLTMGFVAYGRAFLAP